MEIGEDFLYFVWQFQYYDLINLRTTDGEVVHVIQPGFRNSHAGPDFTQVRVHINGIEWIGNAEMHIRSSDWHVHQHQGDAAYDTVILHIVWEHNATVKRSNGTPIPTIELKHKVDHRLFRQYSSLIAAKSVIPCAAQLAGVANIHKRQALDRMIIQRLSGKASFVRELLHANQYDWEETTYQLLARNFGFKINSEAFFRLAKGIPKKILQKHSNSLFQMEALLFGQAAFLDDAGGDNYRLLLQQEYQFLCHKYQLESRKLNQHEWKFARLRPANFPTVRIAQFAALIQHQKALFTNLLEMATLTEAVNWFSVPTSDYWHTHYMFGKATSYTSFLGSSSKENILINTVVPLLVCYSEETDNRIYLDKAMMWLERLPAEDNHIIREWRSVGMPLQSALDAQAGLELFNQYCQLKQCLSCAIGVSLLRTPSSKYTC